MFGWYPKVFANPDLVPVKSFIARCANRKIKTKDENNARVDIDFFGDSVDCKPMRQVLPAGNEHRNDSIRNRRNHHGI